MRLFVESMANLRQVNIISQWQWAIKIFKTRRIILLLARLFILRTLIKVLLDFLCAGGPSLTQLAYKWLY